MKVVVLGSGQMGESVIQHLLPCQDVDEITAYDVNTDRLKELKNKYSIQVEDNLDKILTDQIANSVYLYFVSRGSCSWPFFITVIRNVILNNNYYH